MPWSFYIFLKQYDAEPFGDVGRWVVPLSMSIGFPLCKLLFLDPKRFSDFCKFSYFSHDDEKSECTTCLLFLIYNHLLYNVSFMDLHNCE